MTNQDTTLTNQDDAFKKYWHIEMLTQSLPTGADKVAERAYQAATKASEQRIQELEAEVMKAQSYFMKSQRELRELQSHVNQLLDALDDMVESYQYEASCENPPLINAKNLLSASTAQSLAEHDNATIDRCKNIVADDALAITFQSMGAYRSEIIRQIGALKKQFNGMTEDETRNTMSVKGLSVGGET